MALLGVMGAEERSKDILLSALFVRQKSCNRYVAWVNLKRKVAQNLGGLGCLSSGWMKTTRPGHDQAAIVSRPRIMDYTVESLPSIITQWGRGDSDNVLSKLIRLRS